MEIKTNCPCGSQHQYADCCGLYIGGMQSPPTPEALMRSRYTAYNLANTGYIKKTMSGKALVGFDEIEAKRWAKKANWIGLQIIKTIDKSDAIGFVEFIARFIEGDKLKSIHETSEFYCAQGKWFYVSGVQAATKNTTILRNTPCPCGSQKKFKNCHGNK